jgi:site-specific DNA recombinase
MKIRTIPYGYAMQNGILTPHPEESKILQDIFKEYLDGASLLKIAQNLTAKRTEFLPGRCDWNKNRVKRILEDVRYLGTDTYPKLIDKDMLLKAQEIKGANNNQKDKIENTATSEVKHLPCSVECFCGANMKRRHDKRRKKSQELWTCQNPDCKRIVNINDSTLIDRVTELLNLLISNPDLIQIRLTEMELPIEIRRLQNEVERQLDSYNFEKNEVKKTIFSLAAEKYRQADNKNIISQMIRAELEQQAPLSHFSVDLFKRIVSKLLFDDIGNLILTLNNGQNIGKEHDNADNNSAGS